MVQMRVTIYSKDGCSRCDDAANMCVDSFAESLHFSAERVVGVGLAQAEHASKC